MKKLLLLTFALLALACCNLISSLPLTSSGSSILRSDISLNKESKKFYAVSKNTTSRCIRTSQMQMGLMQNSSPVFRFPYTHRIPTPKAFILVLPAWFETAWFRIASLLLFAMVLYLFVKLRLELISEKNQQTEAKIVARTRKLEQTLRTLEKSEQELQRQMHIQARLIASMSHDIKNPLKFVSKSAGKIDLLIKNEKLGLISEIGKTIEHTADHMHQLLENLITYVKTQVYGSPIQFEETNLSALLSDKLDIFKGMMHEQMNQFINEIDPEIHVSTNPQLLGIIVHNLVDNANKFSSGGIIRTYTEINGSSKRLVISDSGPGMPDQIMQWLNDPSEQESFEKSKVLSSTYDGLGLMIVKEISLMLRINILVEKNPGTTIHLLFPPSP